MIIDIHGHYTTAPKALVTLLGRVSWFLEVNLASMAPPDAESKESLL